MLAFTAVRSQFHRLTVGPVKRLIDVEERPARCSLREGTSLQGRAADSLARWSPIVRGSSAFHPSTVTPKTICEFSASLICMRGSALGSFDSKSSTRPSSGLSEREIGKLTVIV